MENEGREGAPEMSNVMDEVRQLFEGIKGDMALTVDEQVMIHAVITDTVALGARQMAGENVTSELALVKATALNIADAKRLVVQNRLENFMQGLITKLIAAAVVA
jgi:hypothetical protein